MKRRLRYIGPEGFDPSDQFFQAFKAGYVAGWGDVTAPVGKRPAPLWEKYIDWLHEEGVTT